MGLGKTIQVILIYNKHHTILILIKKNIFMFINNYFLFIF